MIDYAPNKSAGRVVFLHVPRTAGTSMKQVLIVNGAQDCSNLRNMTVREHRRFDPEASYTILGHYQSMEHDLFNRQWFNNSLRVAFIRNPWSRLLSLYRYLRGFRLRQNRIRRLNGPSNDLLRGPFADFIQAITDSGRRWLRREKPLGVSLYQANPIEYWLGDGVDVVGRFETLSDDWVTMCNRIGIPVAPLPATNVSGPKQDYRTYYDSGTRDLVATFCAWEIEKFGYTF